MEIDNAICPNLVNLNTFDSMNAKLYHRSHFTHEVQVSEFKLK